MKTKYLLSVVLCLSTPILAMAENASINNPLEAKVVSYKHEKDYDVEFVQTNLPALNKELENLFCNYAFGNESDMEDCQKQDIRQSIAYDYKYKDNYRYYFSQNYKYFSKNNKQYFQVCVMEDGNMVDYCKIYDITNPKKAVLLDRENIPIIEGMGIYSRYFNHGDDKYFLSCLKGYGINDCDLYDVKNPQKPILLEGNLTAYFLNEEQINKIVSYYLAHGNYFNYEPSLSCKEAIAKYGIRVYTDKDRFPEEVKKQCSPEIIKEIDEIDRNNYINKITLSKNPKTYKFPYTIFILTWEVWRGRWGHVDVPDEKTLGELIPQDLWEIFMMER
ncbi:hypothetical protein OFN97_02120 [Campylobacter sp. VBCF_05 NA6]|uniref:hypothetical protein n=1 Tax=unclassified Campylobacter TaxID=2593542 RepID=UPI0022E9A07D|nr:MULTISPECIES: hypothetical protein [unclassified Campylobacter]MDA3057811.1 hypothetical protein [Campylobacter sp. VBCF_04 NA7]MDA3058815.1 hypothetical protein [Campylobacter sp. VBCF_05 NA6]